MKQTTRCLRHPYIETAVVCKRCKTPLCKDCRLKSEKDPYCSSYCLNIDRACTIFSKRGDKRDEKDVFADADRLARFAGNFATLLTASFIIAALMLPATDAKSPTEIAVKRTYIAEIKDGDKRAKPETAKEDKIADLQKPEKADDIRVSPSALSISRVKSAGKSLSITFDGGSSDSSATAILDILSEKQIKTTFFLTGRFIKKYPHIVKRMVAEGHEVGNHTMTHPHLTTYSRDRKNNTAAGVSYSFLKKEMDETARIFKELTGSRMLPLWRAPFGESNKEILSWASKIGYRHIAWTVDYKAHQTMDSLDWVTDKSSSLYRTSEEIKENLLSFADKKGRAKGAIILMHLGTERKNDIVHEKLAEIIEAFMAKGYEILPLSQLIMTREDKDRA